MQIRDSGLNSLENIDPPPPLLARPISVSGLGFLGQYQIAESDRRSVLRGSKSASSHAAGMERESCILAAQSCNLEYDFVFV